jgi:hypothetical protein
MKVTVLVPSEEYKSYAGARIRYGRLTPELQRSAVSLTMVDIAQFRPSHSEADALIISKCHDARSLVAAAGARNLGQLVGVDLFDDYFSQASDPRLSRYRDWLSQMMELCDFALCSTDKMVEVARSYRTNIPTHVLNDPEPGERPVDILDLVERKIADALTSRQLKLAWFGVGDNPFFSVGLTDLASFAPMLTELAIAGFDLELTVMTNARALKSDGLELISKLPLKVKIVEWREDSERALLSDAFAVFLPVNAQRFSAAKSLNRAITALSFGCQILSAGYPLYHALGEFIYREPAELLADLLTGSMRFSRSSFGYYRVVVGTLASAEAEAQSAVRFLRSLGSRASNASAVPIALVHGVGTIGTAHKMVQALGGLSIASPFSTAPLGYDVIFQGETVSEMRMLVSEKAARRLQFRFRHRLRSSNEVSGRRFFEVHEAPKRADASSNDTMRSFLPYQIATYAEVMHRVRSAIQTAFGDCRFIQSETSTFPLRAHGSVEHA